MTTSPTFASITNDVSAYLDKGASTDKRVNERIPQFINDAERFLAKSFELQGFDEVLSFSLTSGLAVYAKPDRWRRTLSMRFAKNLPTTRTTTPLGAPIPNIFNESVPLYVRAYEYVRTMWPDDTKTAPPKWYADYDLEHWVIAPTPDQNYPCEVIIKAMPQLLDTQNQTNFFTQYLPHQLRLAALVNAATFVKAYDEAQTYQGQLSGLMGADTTENLKKITDRSASRQQP